MGIREFDEGSRSKGGHGRDFTGNCAEVFELNDSGDCMCARDELSRRAAVDKHGWRIVRFCHRWHRGVVWCGWLPRQGSAHPARAVWSDRFVGAV